MQISESFTFLAHLVVECEHDLVGVEEALPEGGLQPAHLQAGQGGVVGRLHHPVGAGVELARLTGHWPFAADNLPLTECPPTQVSIYVTGEL